MRLAFRFIVRTEMPNSAFERTTDARTELLL
jgi:hypothetical protein